jgi:hypothetical protein
MVHHFFHRIIVEEMTTLMACMSMEDLSRGVRLEVTTKKKVAALTLSLSLRAVFVKAK